MSKSLLSWIVAFVAATVAILLVAPLTATASLGAPGVATYTYDRHDHLQAVLSAANAEMERAGELPWAQPTDLGEKTSLISLGKIKLSSVQKNWTVRSRRRPHTRWHQEGLGRTRGGCVIVGGR